MRQAFLREPQGMRDCLLRMAGLVESRIDDALTALRTLRLD